MSKIDKILAEIFNKNHYDMTLDLINIVKELHMRSNPEPVKVRFVDEESEKMGIPYYRKIGDAGVDLHVVLEENQIESGLTIFPGERKLLDTGIHVQFPPNIWGLIIHRSSTERRKRLRVVQGIIDNGFRGRLFTQVSNDNTYQIVVNHGSRIAQLILLPLEQREFIKVDNLEDSDRGESGFGSTGF